MALRFLAIGAFVVLSTRRRILRRCSRATQPPAYCGSAPGGARLYAVGTRSARSARARQPPKWTRYSRTCRGICAAASRPPARRSAFVESGGAIRPAAPTATPLVPIDAVTRGDPQNLKAALEGLGLEHAAVYRTMSAAGCRSRDRPPRPPSEVVSVRAAMPRTRAGAVDIPGRLCAAQRVVRAAIRR